MRGRINGGRVGLGRWRFLPGTESREEFLLDIFMHKTSFIICRMFPVTVAALHSITSVFPSRRVLSDAIDTPRCLIGVCFCARVHGERCDFNG